MQESFGMFAHRRDARAFARGLFVILGLWLTPCTAQAINAIQAENLLTGTPQATWDITGVGDPTLQGFATDISVNRGGTVTFKIKTDATSYHIDIYRLGYYQGNGARLQGTGVVTATLPQTQPDPITEAATGLIDCGNWGESAHWDVPAAAVSGIYIARLVRDDTNGASHIAFIVRDDAATGGLLFKTSDATWQAYNGYGGNSLYVGTAPRSNGNAAKVSYNRPFSTRAGGGGSSGSEDWVFHSEYPMVRWLEANGYDVTYTTDLDVDRDPSRLLQHEVFLSVGHDEYWSAGERAAVEAARAAGVHLAFFSGNEVYWKTRWEPSIDGSSTPHRTLVCYKEGTLGENVCGGKCDPIASAWTGLWRDGCAFVPTADGCRPENALSGQISWVGSSGALTVPYAYKDLRFWRNTAVASLGLGQTHTLPNNTLGYEWDQEQFQASYPPGRIKLSSTANSGQTHHLSLYRHASGALVFGAGTVQWSWGLDGTHDNGAEPPSLAMQQATVNLFADMGVQPETLQPGLVAATASADLLAPSSVITSPLNAASLPAGTPFTITGTAAESGGGVLVGVVVSVDGGTTWQPATGTTSWSFAWTPSTTGAVTLMSRGFDDSGNMETTTGGPNVISVTVTPQPPPVCPCTVFQPTDVPANPTVTDGQPIELGMKFRATVDGFITGLRYYKGAGTTGTHVGHLWSAAGDPLAEATFTGETASGWQEVALAAPVAITAGTTYVVSQHSSSGQFAVTNPYFTTAVVNGPLRGLANGEDGPNGVYIYTASPAFPANNFQSSNYYADVVFETTTGPDVTPPVVTSTLPVAGASGVSASTLVRAVFNEALDPARVTSTNVALTGPGATPVSGTVSYVSGTHSAEFDPTGVLAYSTLYTVTLTGGSGGIADVAGNELPADVSWTFTTSAPPPPPPSEGPGGPILVISAAVNPFSRYPVEILRTEGLNAFTAMDLSLVTPAVLSSHDVVVLGECALAPADVTMLSDWTDAGGTLIAFRPDAQLAPLLGLTPAVGSLSDAYLLVNTASGPGAGIVSQTMQFHGTADLYTLSGATSLATLYSDATTATAHPAVTTRSVGTNGGRALAFTYDLARSVVYTRQGNPAWAGTKRDGQIEPIRSDDMFFGAAAGDPQPDWIDFTKIAIPQADEQQRLLANAIIQGNLHRKPLPRFWYLPKGLKAAVVMTGDNHGDGGMASRFDIYRTQSTPGCSAEDWECIRATGYLYLGSAFTPAQATFYKNLGFEVSLHVNTNCARFTAPEYETFVSTQAAAFTSLYPDIPLVSNRNHCISFPDWSTTPEVEAAHGIRFDTNYYYWPAGWVQNRAGLFTGSGMPMRFAKLDGSIIDCFQAVTQMPDESGESFPAFCDALLDRALGAEGYYGAFTTNMHFDSSPHSGSDAIVASAQARGVPVVSAQQMLDWLDGRNGSSFSGLTWSGSQLTFSIAVGAGARNLRAMLPLAAAVGQLAVLTRDGNPVSYSTETIKGIAYAFFPAEAGAYAATYAVDAAPPVITNVVATPTSGTTATVTWTTDEASDSRVDYGTSAGSLSLSASDGALVTSHGVSLTGLAAGATYHFRVTSVDEASNSATDPEPPAAPRTFSQPSMPCFVDQTAADFGLGTAGSGTSIALAGDGEVILTPALQAEFSGVSLPGDWVSAAWNAGGTATVSGGSLTVDGARAYSAASFGPGRSLEYRATYSAGNFQNVGFAGDGDFNNPWIVIGEGSSTNGVYARMDTGAEVLLSTATLGTSHLYRIDWTATGFDFWIDGVLVNTFSRVVAGNLVAMVSDFPVGGSALSVDWLRLTPYASSGSFTSRVFDSGQPTDWGVTTWTATTPSGTSAALFARGGDTPVPDGTWSAYLPLSNGGSLSLHSRYLQYRSDLATSTPGATAELADVAIRCDGTADTSPPIISSVVATPGVSGSTADITWATDEAASSRVDYGTNPGVLSSSSSTASLVTSHARALTGLTPSTTYYYRVTSADAASNSATEPDPPAAPLSFTTPAAPPSVCAQDVTAADFGAGTLAGTRITQAVDGEVTLSPSLDEHFSGASLPAAWGMYDWPFDAGVGTATVSGGLLEVDGARANPEPFASTPGTVLEFVATFSGDGFQHVGFGAGSHLPSGEVFNTTPWAMFSTGSGGSLKARTNNSSSGEDITLPGSYLGAAHTYRIEWLATSVGYFIDGTLVHTSALAVAGAMRPAASDLNVGGGTVTVDQLWATPYVSSGTFTSRVHDAGAAVSWNALSWTASEPPGTALAMEVRRGDTPSPDGTWSAFAPVVSSGGSIAGISRYLQYRASLSTSVAASTPSLADVSATCSACSGPAPDAISDLAISPQAPNPAGLRPIAVTFTAPPGAVAIEVYRAPFGGHPRYDEAGGVLPITPSYPPASPWALTAISTSGQSDLPPGRDQWHYVAYWRNSCGVTSAVSNRPAGVLDYRLGDVSGGGTTCAGDGSVAIDDLSLLGAHYGASLSGSEDFACLDVGPTSDGWFTGRPLTDGQIEFEDLIMFALEFDQPPVAPAARAWPAAAAHDAVRLDQPATVSAGNRFDVIVRVSGSGRVHGLSLQLGWDATRVRPVGMSPGGWLGAQGGVVFSPRPGTVDAALLGRRDRGMLGEGSLAVVTFEALASGAPQVELASVSARDGGNRPFVLGGPAGAPLPPARTAFEGAAPNPFDVRAALRFTLSAEGPVDLSVYSVDGRRVRTLVRGTLPAGAHSIDWDRRSDAGARVEPGLYLIKLTTASGRFTHKLSVVR